MSQANLETVVPQSVNPTTTPADNQQLLAGKYKTKEELVSGYLHQQTETQKIIQQRDELARKAAVLEALVKQPQAGDGRVMPADRIAARASNAVEALTEAINSGGGVDPNLVRAALREEAGTAFAPIVGVMQAQAKVSAELPEYNREQAEVAQFLAANPDVDAEYREMISNPATAAAALKYAWFNMALARERAGLAANAASQTPRDLSGHDQAAARLDAAIPGSGVAGRDAALAQKAEGDLEAAIARGRANNTQRGWADFLSLTLGDLSQGH